LKRALTSALAALVVVSAPAQLTIVKRRPLAAGGGGTPTYVQSNHNAPGSSTTCAVSYSSNSTAGNLAIYVIRVAAAGRAISSVTDTQGNTHWTQAAAQDQTSDGHGLFVWYAWNINGGANTVTGTVSGAAATVRCQVFEYSGVLSTGDPLDKTVTASSGAAANAAPDSTATATTTQAKELVFGAASVGGVQTFTAGNDGNGHPMTLRQSTSAEKIGSEDVTVSATEAAKATFSLGANDLWTCIVATFKGS